MTQNPDLSATDDELIAFARTEMRRAPNGNTNPRRIDAPLRSVFDPAYIAEKKAAEAAEAAVSKPATPGPK